MNRTIIKIANLDMSQEAVFDGKAYVLNQKDLGYSDINLSTFQGYNQIGVKVTGRAVNSRDITITGFVFADDADTMLTRKRFLQTLVNPTEDWYLIIGDYKIQVSSNSTLQWDAEWSHNNELLARFLIQGTCANPCFTPLNSVRAQIAYWQGSLHFPLHPTEDEPILMGYRNPAQIKCLVNDSPFDIGVKITMTSQITSVTNPYIENLLTGEKMQFTSTLELDDVLEINTNYGEKTIKLNGVNAFNQVDVTSDFLVLHPGENYLHYGADANADYLVIDMVYEPRYLTV